MIELETKKISSDKEKLKKKKTLWVTITIHIGVSFSPMLHFNYFLIFISSPIALYIHDFKYYFIVYWTLIL
jgi:hypothetical protein